MIAMSNLENLARAIGEDVKAIKEDSALKDREVKERLDSLESRPTGETIVNQQNRISMRYWAGTQAQYDAIRIKDSNTIYDIFK